MGGPGSAAEQSVAVGAGQLQVRHSGLVGTGEGFSEGGIQAQEEKGRHSVLRKVLASLQGEAPQQKKNKKVHN